MGDVEEILQLDNELRLLRPVTLCRPVLVLLPPLPVFEQLIQLVNGVLYITWKCVFVRVRVRVFHEQF